MGQFLKSVNQKPDNEDVQRTSFGGQIDLDLAWGFVVSWLKRLAGDSPQGHKRVGCGLATKQQAVQDIALTFES